MLKTFISETLKLMVLPVMYKLIHANLSTQDDLIYILLTLQYHVKSIISRGGQKYKHTGNLQPGDVPPVIAFWQLIQSLH